ncbi:unnamed protein product [Bubo scandiacus]
MQPCLLLVLALLGSVSARRPLPCQARGGGVGAGGAGGRGEECAVPAGERDAGAQRPSPVGCHPLSATSSSKAATASRLPRWAGDGHWRSLNCQVRLPFICEY